ncbi:ArpU family transcriptional regulator [Brevibacillus laterosporus]|nr:ArpU family phage packaging/lysis transcriptional regulator [Brevibacillus laterosporus]TPG86865.1 ArpU family transcriptional regulator [Brevibacillus laterosporus]
MNTQLSFLPEIDRKATQKNVERYLETARIYKQIGFVRREIGNTPSYEYRENGPTNKTSDPVADVAMWNVDHEKKIKELAERVDWAVSKLSARQMQIIQKRYLEHEDALDCILYHELNMSKRTYEREKARAFYLLALMLKVEVIVEGVA